jgi:DMSO reductase iron-sulfur subunit
MSEKIQYGMVIDTTRCMGCQTCVVTCKVSHQTPKGVYWCKVKTEGSDVMYRGTGKFPSPELTFLPQLCNHCENPACVANCPTGAMHKREDGIVEVDQDVCIGCQYCYWNCPYGAPVFDTAKKTISKCNLCAERLEEGELPYCVESCPAEARHIGIISDPSSEISKLIAAKDAKPLRPEYGTKPSVYYI